MVNRAEDREQIATGEEDDLRRALDKMLSDSGLRIFKAPGWDGGNKGFAAVRSLADDPVVVDALRAGASNRELAENLSVNVHTIAKIRTALLKRGVISKRSGGGRPIKYTNEVIATVLGLHSRGLRPGAISRKASVSRDAVVMIIRREIARGRAKPREFVYAEAA